MSDISIISTKGGFLAAFFASFFAGPFTGCLPAGFVRAWLFAAVLPRERRLPALALTFARDALRERGLDGDLEEELVVAQVQGTLEGGYLGDDGAGADLGGAAQDAVFDDRITGERTSEC